MTVPPADPTAHSARAAAWRLAVGLIAWAIYFGALVAVYLIAFDQHYPAVQQAAAWGLSIALAFSLLTIPVALQYLDARSGFSPRRLTAWPGMVLTCAILAAGSVAVIWVAMNLALASHPVGAWILVPPAAVSVITVLAGLGGWRVRPGATGTAATPPVSATALPVFADIAPPAEAVEPNAVAAQPGTAEIEAEVAAPRPAGLLSPDWASRIGRSFPAVALDSGFWRLAVEALVKSPTEQGGVALIARSNESLLILGAVFPSQVGASSTHCEFSTVDVERVRHALDSVADELGIGPGDVAMTWVHTHPKLGVFLSGTDHGTSRYWRELDPGFTPIVIDAHKKNLAEQIGVFDAEGHRLSPMRLIEGLVNDWAMLRLSEALFEAYHADGRPEPLVLLAGV